MPLNYQEILVKVIAILVLFVTHGDLICGRKETALIRYIFRNSSLVCFRNISFFVKDIVIIY